MVYLGPFFSWLSPMHVARAEGGSSAMNGNTSESTVHPAPTDNGNQTNVFSSTFSSFAKKFTRATDTPEASPDATPSASADTATTGTVNTTSDATPPPSSLYNPKEAAVTPVSSLNVSNRTEPISLEQFSREYQALSFQDNFDGFRLETTKQLNKYLLSSHSFSLGSHVHEHGSYYQFGPTLASSDGSFLLTSRMGIDGTATGRMAKRFSNGYEIRGNVNSSLADYTKNFYEFSLDKVGYDWTSSLKLAWQGAWILNGSFTQVITPNLQLGGDLTYVTGNGATIGGIAGRYTIGKNIFTGQVFRQPDFKSMPFPNIHSCKLNFHRKVTDRFSVGSEFEYSHPGMESALRLGWEYTFRNARIQSLVDTSGKISVMAQDGSGIAYSGVADYWRNDYRFGFMLQIFPFPSSAANTPTM